MATAKVSPSERMDKASMMRVKAMAIEKGAKIQLIHKVLKARPDLCTPVCDCLAEQGIDLDKAATQPELLTKSAPLQLNDAAAAQSKGSSGSSTRASTADGDNEQEAQDKIPRSETTLGMIHLDRLMVIASRMQPVAFSKHTLKLLKPSPQRGIPKARLLELIEFDTGAGPDSYIGTDGRLKSQEVLTNRLIELSVANNLRGRDLSLPPDFHSHGVYKVEVDGGKIYIVHKFAKAGTNRKELPASQARLVDDHRALRLDRNYSEMGAVLVETKGIIRYRVHNLFPNEGLQDPLQYQANQYMLEDGAAEDPEATGDAAPMPRHAVVAKGLAEGSSGVAQVGRPRTKRLAAAADSPPMPATTSGKKCADTDAKNAEAEHEKATASEASPDDKKKVGAPPTKASLPDAWSVEMFSVVFGQVGAHSFDTWVV